MSKFDDIVNGKVNASKEDVEQAIKEEIGCCKTLKEVNDLITKFSPSDAYKIIRDIIKPKHNIVVLSAKQSDVQEYQRFQDIQQEAKRMFDYERTNATMFDVHRISEGIATRYYNILVRMVSVLDDELGKVEHAVNTIEGHIGIDVTNFEIKEENHDTTESGNEQGSEETTE